MRLVALFGGSGFIGTHLANFLLQQRLAERVLLVDIHPPRRADYASELRDALDDGRATFVHHDVREPIPQDLASEAPELIFNLAAVHREPGHQPREYFATNLPGAENVCRWASEVDCRLIVFTSSISPYGPSEDRRTESSLPTPETAYGSSKLASEKIHLVWQAAAPGRQLLTLRPGVVYGPGEGGNVTRLVRSLASGYFVYTGNREVVKAAGYVKELCRVALFGVQQLRDTGDGLLLLNFTSDPPPTLEQMVQAIQRTLGRQRKIFSIPRGILLALSYPLAMLEPVLGKKLPVNPTRVRKLFRSNNIWPGQLRALGYSYTYTLDSAFADWKRDQPQDFA